MSATATAAPPLTVERWGWAPQAYRPVWQAMRDYTERRDAATPDALWLLSHAPVFTQGKNGRAEHLLAPGDIDVVAIDRGGQVTYHGPGQIMAYTLLDIKRLGLGIRGLVSALEQAMIETLEGYDIHAHARRDAPGVYVGDAKIGSIGLRVRNGCCYHGLALNVDMDLAPYARIDPCGYHGLAITQIRDLASPADLDRVGDDLTLHLARQLRVPSVEAAESRGGPSI